MHCSMVFGFGFHSCFRCMPTQFVIDQARKCMFIFNMIYIVAILMSAMLGLRTSVYNMLHMQTSHESASCAFVHAAPVVLVEQYKARSIEAGLFVVDALLEGGPRRILCCCCLCSVACMSYLNIMLRHMRSRVCIPD